MPTAPAVDWSKIEPFIKPMAYVGGGALTGYLAQRLFSRKRRGALGAGLGGSAGLLAYYLSQAGAPSKQSGGSKPAGSDKVPAAKTPIPAPPPQEAPMAEEDAYNKALEQDNVGGWYLKELAKSAPEMALTAVGGAPAKVLSKLPRLVTALAGGGKGLATGMGITAMDEAFLAPAGTSLRSHLFNPSEWGRTLNPDNYAKQVLPDQSRVDMALREPGITQHLADYLNYVRNAAKSGAYDPATYARLKAYAQMTPRGQGLVSIVEPEFQMNRGAR